MPKCTDETVEVGWVGRRVVEADFDGGNIVSDGGVLLLKRVDERLGLTRAVAKAFGDGRRSASVQHSVHSLLAQRVMPGHWGPPPQCSLAPTRHRVFGASVRPKR